MDFSFIHVSDIHLGRPFSDLSKYSYDENVKKIYKSAIEKVFNNIIDFAILKNVDFVLIAGDTFDSKEQDFSSKLILKEGLQKLASADIDVFLICGNHDCLNSYNKNTFNFNENSKIKIIGLNTPSYCELPLYNKNSHKVGILRALSFTEEKFNENPLKYFSQIKEEEKNIFNIGLLHCDLNADSSSPYAPCSLAEMKSFNYNYWALGHIHKPSSDNGNILYAGTVQGRNTKETGSHGIRYIKVDNNQIIKNLFVPVDVVRFEDIKCDLSSCSDITGTFDLIKEQINKTAGTSEICLIRLELSGYVGFLNEINDEFFDVLSEKIRTVFSGNVFISQITNSIKALADSKLLNQDDGITGEIFKTVNNSEIIQNSFDNLTESLKNIIVNCNFNIEEFNLFAESVKQNAKEECISICSEIYNKEIRDV